MSEHTLWPSTATSLPSRSARWWPRTCLRLLRRLMIGLPFDAKKFRLENTDPYILGLLQQSQSQRDDDANSSWFSNFEKALRTKGMRFSDCTAPVGVRASPRYLALPARCRAAIGYIKVCRPDVESADLSRSIGRNFASTEEGVYPTMLPKHIPSILKQLGSR